MISVVVSSPDLIVRAGLESILRSHPDIAVITTQGEDYAPDVLLLQHSAQDYENLSDLLYSALAPPPAIVILTDNLHNDLTESALRSGVRAVLPRSATADEILATVEAAAAGLIVLHPDVIDFLLPPITSKTLPSSPTQALTPREIEVLGMLAEGLGNKTIARRLSISEHTVKFHVSSIFQKLNASSRTEAALLGARLGLIML